MGGTAYCPWASVTMGSAVLPTWFLRPALAEGIEMPKNRWRLHRQLQLKDPLSKRHPYAQPGETLEALTELGTTDSPEYVRVYRADEVQSYIVSLAELEANATPIEE